MLVLCTTLLSMDRVSAFVVPQLYSVSLSERLPRLGRLWRNGDSPALPFRVASSLLVSWRERFWSSYAERKGSFVSINKYIEYTSLSICVSNEKKKHWQQRQVARIQEADLNMGFNISAIVFTLFLQFQFLVTYQFKLIFPFLKKSFQPFFWPILLLLTGKI